MKKREYAVGEEFQFGLKKLKCVKGEIGKCDGCYFHDNPVVKCTDALIHIVGGCGIGIRTDMQKVKFIEVE